MTTRKPTILLTGATGVIGRVMIDELADDYDIVGLRHRKAVNDPRVVEVHGDLGALNLGLTETDYHALARRVDAVVQIAAATAWTLAPETIRATNLGGTERMLAFASRAGAPLYYFSTAFVANPPKDDGSGRLTGVAAYVQSKIDSERMIGNSGQPAVILRPSVVIGDSRDGHIARFQGFHLAIGAMMLGTVPVLPAEMSSLIDAVPQDVVARAAGRLIRDGVTNGECWLSAGTDSMRLGRIVDVCMEFAARVGLNPHRPRLIASEAVERLLLPLLDGALTPKLAAQFRQFLELMWLFQTPAALESSLPALGEHVYEESLLIALERNLEFWAQRKRLPLVKAVEAAA